MSLADDFDDSAVPLRRTLVDVGVRGAAHLSEPHLRPQHRPTVPVLRKVGSNDSLPALRLVSATDVRLEVEMETKGLELHSFFQLHMVPEWRHKYLDYERLEQQLAKWFAARADGAGVASLLEHELTEEVQMIEEFYRDQEQSFVSRHILLVGKIARCASMAHPHDVGVQDPALATGEQLKGHLVKMKEARQFHLARDAIKRAVEEHAYGVETLERYCALNKLAIMSLVAHYEHEARVREAPSIVARITNLIENQSFAAPTVGLQLVELEQHFNSTFYPNETPPALMEKKKKRVFRSSAFFIGLCLGLTVANIVLIIYLLATTSNALALPYWSSQYLIFRGAFLVLLMFWFQGINMLVWDRMRVNYPYILEIGHPRSSFFDLFVVLSPLTAISTLLFTLYLFAARGEIATISPRWFGFIEFVILLLVISFPFNWLLRNSRGWLLMRVLRFVTAPLSRVHFADFYVGDQICSCLVALYDVEFSFCFIFYDVWTDGTVCVQTAPIARLCLAGIPSWFRFLQSLRRWRDSKFKERMHLANAAKFATVFAVVIVNGIGKGLGVTTVVAGQPFPPVSALFCFFLFFRSNLFQMSIAFIVVSAISYIFFSYWDLTVDWGLFKRHQKPRFLRKELLFRYPLLYYLAIPTDLILRLAWIITVSPGLFGISLNNDLLQFCLAVAEQTRRFMWNFFRMENEATNNVGKYRAVLEVPVPYDDEVQPAASLVPSVGTHEAAAFLREHLAHMDGGTPVHLGPDPTKQFLEEEMQFDDYDSDKMSVPVVT